MDEEYGYFEVTIGEECGSVNGYEHNNRNTETEDFAHESDFNGADFLSNRFVNAAVNQRDSTIEELLISFVESNPPLWNHRIPLMERTKTIKERLWVEIQIEFGDTDLSLAVLQKKWKNLRDTYIKTKAEVEVYVPTGASQKKRKRVCKHYESMKFLSDSVVPRR
ncbi:unnamed protein product [Psylliodes chrysocephalus]|uniref:MADF domain-containing protein n=1 Tax=Psylliodes chrysocephalus TaxID=3402493 RepID=A0A9P0GKF8_9CUCU|nr:unnamed protein product [Psylliodes chrysocephala]